MKVVHCKKEPYDILIDRRTKWGNPFLIGKDGDRDEVIKKYEVYARKMFTVEELLTLRNKTLGCWCRPLLCHGDILVKLVEEVS